MNDITSRRVERIEAALALLSSTGPRSLQLYLTKPGPDFDPAGKDELPDLLNLLLTGDPNASVRLRFSNLIREWDNTKTSKWAGGTPRNTSARRLRIHELLGSSDVLQKRIDVVIPFYPLEEPLMIKDKHEDWYLPTTGVHDYYWQTYRRYLMTHRRWDHVSLQNLANTTQSIVECLSNPESTGAYSSRGLVMGYVQSGKTANFAGVIARAADAGYRLIIVLAGTWNILRDQTQRRLDKELLGKELLDNDDIYKESPPSDWNDFLEHGFYPPDRGHYPWQRLTRPDIDFKRLKTAIDTLEFEKRERNLPLYHPNNLHALPAKLLVVKKHSVILDRLSKDLGLLRTKLEDLPTLIIDDESDQAGLNTVDPKRQTKAGKERSTTNKKIVNLLKAIPRAQYVGYTATPYANALVDVNDPEDLFPKDFIISLHRPSQYMGVSDFFDADVDYEDLDRSDYSQKEIAFIRRVNSPDGSDDEELQNALRSYVLSGALKLYRETKDPESYRFQHHTMLIHTSSRTSHHKNLESRIADLWQRCGFNTTQGMVALRNVWEKDYSKVSKYHADGDLLPENFDDLIPHFTEVLSRIERGNSFILVVNSDKKDAPDFNEESVWKVIIGGNKLSRGYTIEGLTVSYYRRVTNTADTLMQMGRWFGFRKGYRDLVRVFLGVNEARSIDLVALFKQVCLMEERFRHEIRRYVRDPDLPRITPRQIPPLISVVGQLPPTSRNKMFNARIESRNYGGRWSQPTMLPFKGPNIKANSDSLSSLLEPSTVKTSSTLGGVYSDGKTSEWKAKVFTVNTVEVIKFLESFRWLETEYANNERPTDISLQAEFLRNPDHGISSWMIIAPQVDKTTGPPWEANAGNVTLSVKKRGRMGGKDSRFKVFGEPHHRAVSEFLIMRTDSKKPFKKANVSTIELQDKHRGVMLLYPVRENEAAPVSVGFELLFPHNNLPFDVNFTVRKKAESERIIVEATE